MSLHYTALLLLLLGVLGTTSACSHLPASSMAAGTSTTQSNIKLAVQSLRLGDVINVKTAQDYYREVKVVGITEHNLQTELANLPLSSIEYIELSPSANDKTLTVMHSGALLTLGVFLLSALGAGVFF